MSNILYRIYDHDQTLAYVDQQESLKFTLQKLKHGEEFKLQNI